MAVTIPSVTYRFGQQPFQTVPGGALDQDFQDAMTYASTRSVLANDYPANGVSGPYVDPNGQLDSTQGILKALASGASNVWLLPGQYLISGTNGLTIGNGNGAVWSTTSGVRL